MKKKNATQKLLSCLTRRRVPSADTTNTAPPRPQIAGIGFNTRVVTDFGPVPIQLLRPGDKLKSSDGSWIRVKALRRFGFDKACLEHLPEARGVFFPAGSLGHGVPQNDVVLGPDQRIAAPHPGGAHEARSAAECVGHAGIRRVELAEAVYFVPVCVGTGAILAEGMGVGALIERGAPTRAGTCAA